MDKETTELLAWYVNGTLTGADRERVEAALRNEAGASSQVAWEQSIQAATKSDPALDVAADRGLHQTMQRIRADARPQGAARAARAGWLSSFGFQWSPALALACGVVAVQFAVIAQMWSASSDESEYASARAVGSRSLATGTFVRITFKPESAERDLNALLRTVHAEIVSGPSQLGDYYLLVEKRGAQNALRQLQASANVESAEIVNALPARP